MTKLEQLRQYEAILNDELIDATGHYRDRIIASLEVCHKLQKEEL